MTSYSNEEQETVISWDKAGLNATVYTFEFKWQKHIEKTLGTMPLRESKNGCAKEYEIPKRWLLLPRKPSKARAEAMRKRMAGGPKKSPNPSRGRTV